MNVVIVGGGQRFGRDIADRFRQHQHDVFVVSHKSYADNDSRHIAVDFNDIDSVVTGFRQLTADIDHLDILLYNSNRDFGPRSEHYCAGANARDIKTAWLDTLNVSVVVPHALAVVGLEKMDDQSRIVFMTSDMSRDLDRSYCLDAASYAGGKAAQNHLMLALASCNNVGAIVYSISPNLQKTKYHAVVDSIYRQLVRVDSSNQKKIIGIYD